MSDMTPQSRLAKAIDNTHKRLALNLDLSQVPDDHAVSRKAAKAMELLNEVAIEMPKAARRASALDSTSQIVVTANRNKPVGEWLTSNGKRVSDCIKPEGRQASKRWASVLSQKATTAPRKMFLSDIVSRLQPRVAAMGERPTDNYLAVQVSNQIRQWVQQLGGVATEQWSEDSIESTMFQDLNTEALLTKLKEKGFKIQGSSRDFTATAKGVKAEVYDMTSSPKTDGLVKVEVSVDKGGV